MTTTKLVKSLFPQRKWLRWLLIAFLSFIMLGVIFAIWFSIWFAQLNISKLAEPLPLPTLIYDKNAKLISQLSSTKIEAVTLSEIPQQLRDAVIATEDRRFYDHSGVDLRSILRALWRDLRSGGLVEGGSTITQQLAKNMFLPMDKTFGRKLKEAAYALKIETSYSKDEILVLYLNSIYYGEGQWGIQRAAKTYFGKNTKDLNLVESATLAGLPKAPSKYNPLRNKDGALNRRNIVLSLMNEQKKISDTDFKLAFSTPLLLAAQNQEIAKQSYPDFIDAILSEATELYGFTEGQLLTSGLSIYSSVEPKIQLAAESVYADNQFFPESKPDQLIQSGTVIIDQHSGEIRGIVGHRGDGVYRGFNYATKLKRQPGSAFKPLSVYGPALEQGYTQDSMLSDSEININGYQPRDYDLQNRGQVTLKEAISRSYNIPAVWLLHEIGIDTGINFATRTGITLAKDDRNLGIALGGMSEGTSPLLMAQAYTSFANLGDMHPAHTIVRIVTSSGLELVNNDFTLVKVTSPTVAYTMTTLLLNVVDEGTGNAAALDRPTAGKTGTTELPDTAEFNGIASSGAVSKDAWFVGYTPELTAAVWMGYEKTDKDHYLTSGSTAAAKVFKEIMSRALLDQPIVPFSVPADFTITDKGKDEDKHDEKDNKDDKDDKDKKDEKPNKHENKPRGNHGKGKDK
ncbi:PBP1A family penicillin-binding protein [Paenibacillus psychroresistens]|uniref:PBP1A family penicillin-binding protein n=1 Tax=Paenibacillus psychroresistens TaxID=1778678 RepID=A0A6B8RJ87_9BACL|nr:PBP1A family penicillin-binding protein [Paenibacillus psychroresistens]QGQ96531.1 PBP1A family penicillin-binding protein [Paenibacillus psychroresistens]